MTSTMPSLVGRSRMARLSNTCPMDAVDVPKLDCGTRVRAESLALHLDVVRTWNQERQDIIAGGIGERGQMHAGSDVSDLYLRVDNDGVRLIGDASENGASRFLTVERQQGAEKYGSKQANAT